MRLTAGCLLLLAAALAAAGSFGALRVRSGGGYVQVLTGWGVDLTGTTPANQEWVARFLVLDGLPLVVGGCAGALAAALLLVRPGPGRAVALVASGVLVGSTAAIWLTLIADITTLRGSPDSTSKAEIGGGAWSVLAAAMIALVAAAIAMELPTTAASRPPYPVHRSGRRPRALVAGGLLVAVAVLAVVGSVTAMSVRTSVTTRAGRAEEPRTFTTTGWTYTDSAQDVADANPPLIGIPLVIGATVALATAALLLRGFRRPGDPMRARLLGLGACGVLIGTGMATWLGLLTAMHNETGVSAGELRIDSTTGPGPGAWLLLLAVTGGLIAVGLLLAPLGSSTPLPPASMPPGPMPSASMPPGPMPSAPMPPAPMPPAPMPRGPMPPVPMPMPPAPMRAVQGPRAGKITGARIGMGAVGVVAIGLLVIGLLSADPDADPFASSREFRIGHTGDVNAVATAELDGRPVIVSGGDDRTVRVWEMTTGAPIGRPLTGHEGHVSAVAVTRLDGRPVIVSAGDGIRVWDLATGAPIGEPITASGGALNAMAVAEVAGRPVVVSGGYGDAVEVRELSTGARVGLLLTGAASSVFSVAVTELAGRPVVVAGTLDGKVLVWDMASGAPIGGPIAAHGQAVHALAVADLDGRPVILSGGDSTVRMWDLATGSPIRQPILTHPSVQAMAITQLDGRPVLVSAGSRAQVWELATGVPIGAALTGPTDSALRDVAVTQLDGEPVVVAAGSNGVIRTWGPGATRRGVGGLGRW